MSNLAIIPARSGSKGIPNKNIKNFNGKPLIHWTIKSALKSSFVDKVVVTTDSEKIAKIARKSGAEVPFLRPDSISGDYDSTELAINHTLNELKKIKYTPKNIILLQATSPVRKNNSIDNAFKFFKKMKADSLVSVGINGHFNWTQNINKFIPNYNIYKRPMRQEIKNSKQTLFENGSIYIFTNQGFIKNKNRLFGKIICYVMDHFESIDIDNKTDWEICKILHKFLRIKKLI